MRGGLGRGVGILTRSPSRGLVSFAVLLLIDGPLTPSRAWLLDVFGGLLGRPL
ncbi:hypothetical protein OROGR_005088 [Orobanche gracilis]